ncbi:arginase family protein [Nocardia alni]|uniref:arginase family protein n=1 Tax=Nocardia alni TaxID=2815723 RepID=UPI001C233FBA|nr:arginase family protein [Nocardia alni]
MSSIRQVEYILEKPSRTIGQFRALEELDLPIRSPWAIVGLPVSFDCLHTDNNPSLGPAAIRGAFPYLEGKPAENRDYSIWDWNRGNSIPIADILPTDLGNLLTPSGSSLEYTIDAVHEIASKVYSADMKPLMIGGEHSLTLGAIKAAVERFDGIYVVQFDAHTDRSLQAASPSRVFNGNFMSHILDLDRIAHVFQIGIREIDYARSGENPHMQGATCITADEARDWARSSRVYESIPARAPVYITIDIDVLDPAFAPEVAWPVSGGLVPRELSRHLRFLLERKTIIGVDLMELTGTRYGPNLGALAGSRLLLSILSNGFLS